MYEYIIGKISYSNSNYIILENNFIGYKLFVNGSESLDKKSFHRFYIYTKINQTNKGYESYEYYGFKSIAEKYFFETLLSLNGIGPKTAMQILKNDISLIKSLIIKNDTKTLQNLIGFNEKIAISITNQLGYKLRSLSLNKKTNDLLYVDQNNNENNKNYILDIANALKALGYKKPDIEYSLIKVQEKIETLENIDNLDINEYIGDAIKIILGKNENITTKTH